jgi:hypothetical protein
VYRRVTESIGCYGVYRRVTEYRGLVQSAPYTTSDPQGRSPGHTEPVPVARRLRTGRAELPRAERERPEAWKVTFQAPLLLQRDAATTCAAER